MASENFSEGPSTRFKQQVEAPRRLAKLIWEKWGSHEGQFENKVTVYENKVDINDLNHHNPNFTELVEAQG